ncbi:VOC family protein [Dyella silvatica]|uniref:VOC family protein n=1 Tax=Dyella silvatica TaxID=2992128 RepID=UPI00224D1672|nr:VOC family protein [Dyella silvatica]
MAKVIGFGGIFFKSQNPAALAEWYAKHLGLTADDSGCVRFKEDESRAGYSLWVPFAADTKYFGSGPQSYMLNLRVDDLPTLLASLRAAGITVEEPAEQSEFGGFGWIVDPEGTRIELWQPPEPASAS